MILIHLTVIYALEVTHVYSLYHGNTLECVTAHFFPMLHSVTSLWCSLKLAVEGVFTPYKSSNATSQAWLIALLIVYI